MPEIVKFYTLFLDPENRTLFSDTYTGQITECPTLPPRPPGVKYFLHVTDWQMISELYSL